MNLDNPLMESGCPEKRNSCTDFCRKILRGFWAPHLAFGLAIIGLAGARLTRANDHRIGPTQWPLQEGAVPSVYLLMRAEVRMQNLHGFLVSLVLLVTSGCTAMPAPISSTAQVDTTKGVLLAAISSDGNSQVRDTWFFYRQKGDKQGTSPGCLRTGRTTEKAQRL